MMLCTGRSASRAFYLNFKNQSSVVAMSRIQLDHMITAFIKNNDSSDLDRISDSYRTFSSLEGNAQQLCLVFHGVRRLLEYPFNSERNRELLSRLRDAFDIKVVFFPVRDQNAVFVSELNRILAQKVGDWKFPEKKLGWKTQISMGDIAEFAGREPPPPKPPKIKYWGRISSLAKKISERTGKIHTLHTLFSSVFDDVVIIDYEKFLDDPAYTFGAIANKAGFQLDRTNLFDIKLNSLTNRLLFRNPIRLQAFDKVVRYRVELKAVQPLCDDWGNYISLTIPETESVATIAREMGSEIAFGICDDDLTELSRFERQILTDPVFVEDLAGSLLPTFVTNFLAMKDYFQNTLYFREAPAKAAAIFQSANSEEIERMNEHMSSADKSII